MIPYLSLLRDLDPLLPNLSRTRRCGEGLPYFRGGDRLLLLGDGLHFFLEEVKEAGGETEALSCTRLALSRDRLRDRFRLSGDLALLFGGLIDLRLGGLIDLLLGLIDRLLGGLIDLLLGGLIDLLLGGLIDLLEGGLIIGGLTDRLSLLLSLLSSFSLLSSLLSSFSLLLSLVLLSSRSFLSPRSLERLLDRLLFFDLVLSKGERLLDRFLDLDSLGDLLRRDLSLSLLLCPLGGDGLLDFLRRFFLGGDLLLEREDRLGDLAMGSTNPFC